MLHFNTQEMLAVSADYPKGVHVSEGDILFYISLVGEKLCFLISPQYCSYPSSLRRF